jgi:hypothetical protein
MDDNLNTRLKKNADPDYYVADEFYNLLYGGAAREYDREDFPGCPAITHETLFGSDECKPLLWRLNFLVLHIQALASYLWCYSHDNVESHRLLAEMAYKKACEDANIRSSKGALKVLDSIRSEPRSNQRVEEGGSF